MYGHLVHPLFRWSSSIIILEVDDGFQRSKNFNLGVNIKTSTIKNYIPYPSVVHTVPSVPCTLYRTTKNFPPSLTYPAFLSSPAQDHTHSLSGWHVGHDGFRSSKLLTGPSPLSKCRNIRNLFLTVEIGFKLGVIFEIYSVNSTKT